MSRREIEIAERLDFLEVERKTSIADLAHEKLKLSVAKKRVENLENHIEEIKTEIEQLKEEDLET